MTILIFLLVLTVLVLIHELGHYLVAKKFNIKVEEFGIGLPPRAWGKKIGETIYSLNWLPIGGFVKLYGEDEAGAGKVGKIKQAVTTFKDRNRAFFARPWWQRFLVGFAGVFMNFVLAVLIFAFLFAVVGTGVPKEEVLISQVVAESPAQKAGLKAGDIVQRLNNTKITSTNQLVSETRKYAGKEIILLIKRGSQMMFVELTPRRDFPKDQGPLGIAIAQNFEIKKYPWYQAPIAGLQEAFKVSALIVTGLGTVIYQLVSSGIVPKDVAGPVGIAQLTGQFVQVGPYAVLSFVALLSLNLAILNVLPFPALDGGRLFFILIEAITGRKVNQRFESLAHAVGMAILLGLIAVITLHDITRLFSGTPLIPK
jgi:regulator of sigma E protease